MTITSETDRVIGRLRQEVCDLHAQLTRYALVIWTAGNVSARVPDRDLMVIKPSGADYDSLTADDMVVCDLHGNLVDGHLSPSSDTAARAMGRVNRGAHQPIAANVAAYDELYAEYRALHDHFGRGGNDVLRRLRRSRHEVPAQ